MANIRHKEIEQIKELMKMDLSQSEIARRLKLNRLTVRFTMKNIQDGKPLRFENKPTLRERFDLPKNNSY
jgi:DNA invertase Pin-like site-specific DNA recombinase